MIDEMWCWDDANCTLNSRSTPVSQPSEDNSPEKILLGIRNNELERFAIGVHGGMAAGYALTLPYHYRRRKWLYFAIGIAGVVFHSWSVLNHLEE